MPNFVAKRVLFRNGERYSVLSRPGGLPVHEATLYLAKYRKRGRVANTIHGVCMTLALVHRELDMAGTDLLQQLRQGQFLRRKSSVEECRAVGVASQATRLRYMADYLEFLAMYMGATLPASLRKELTLRWAD